MDKSASSDEAERRSFACPPRRGRLRDIDLSYLDPGDPDDRHLLILSEHPDLAQAIERGEHELVIGGEPMSPNLHIAVHEIVTNQLWDDDPPEVWQTARRLLAAGHERHEVLHALAGVAVEEIWQIRQQQKPFDRKRYVRALRKLR